MICLGALSLSEPMRTCQLKSMEYINEIPQFSPKRINLKVLSAKRGPFCFSLNVLTPCGRVTPYGDLNLGQTWLRQWLVACCLTHILRPIPQEVLKVSICKTS